LIVFRKAVVAVMLVSLVGCTTTQTLRDVTPETVVHQVEPGDRAIIVAKNGKTYDLLVLEVGTDSLVGKTEPGKLYRVKYTAIESIRIERTDRARAREGVALLVLVGIGLVVLIVVGMRKLGEELSCNFGACDDES
jgi:hypothetical protein